MKKTKILWISRHVPTDTQMEDLRCLFGDVQVIRISQTFETGGDVAVLAKQHDVDEVMAVLPMQMIAQLIRAGVKPIRAVMRRGENESGDITYEHIAFERVLSIEVITKRLYGKL